MDCEEAEELFLDAADAKLEARSARLLDSHIEACLHCRTRFNETRELLDALRAVSLPGDSVHRQFGRTVSPAGQDHGRPSPSDLTGERLGDFEIIEELGRGGMGVVYRARQISLNRIVAVKLLPAGPRRTEQAVQRFQAEAQAAAKLQHPNIVPVYAEGEQDGQFYYVMELIEGRPLNETLESRRVDAPGISATSGKREDFRRIARFVADVADALEYAHQRGVVHRDIKPQNLLVGSDGRPHVTDFGLARAMEGPNLTLTGEMLGTPAYMSPEQISADRDKIDQRTDIYSLGVTMYEMLTSWRPFEGRTREQIISQVRTKEPRPPRRINHRIPVDLETICLRALEKNPARRFQTARQMADDLRRYLDNIPIVSRRAGPLIRSSKWIRRHPTVTIGALGILIVASLLLGYTLKSRRQRANDLVRDVYEMLVFQDYQRSKEAKTMLAEASALGADVVLFEIASALADIRGTSEDKLRHLDAALAKDPQNVTALYLKAWALRGANPAMVPEYLRRADELSPEKERLAEQWFLRGQALIRLGADRAEEAIECYRKAINVRPDYPQAMLHLARALNNWMFHHRSVERLDEIVDKLTAVADLRPNQAYPHYLLSITHRLAGEILAETQPGASADQYDRAFRSAIEAQRNDPNNPLGYIVEAELHTSRRDYERAVYTYDRALGNAESLQKSGGSQAPARKVEILRYRWRLRFWNGDNESALNDLQSWFTSWLHHSKKTDLSDTATANDLWLAGPMQALVLASMGRFDEARKVAQIPATESPETVAALLASAGGMWLLGHADEGNALLERRSGDVVWSTRGYPYETAEWNRTLYRFCLGEVGWKEVDIVAGELNDPSWLLAQAHFFDAIRELSEGRRSEAMARLFRCVETYDYERYSYLARTLLRKMELDPTWPHFRLAKESGPG